MLAEKGERADGLENGLRAGGSAPKPNLLSAETGQMENRTATGNSCEKQLDATGRRF
jgi:hypothetical protein